jgi:hypothetical protein
MDVHRSYGYVASVRETGEMNAAGEPGCITEGPLISPTAGKFPHPTSQEFCSPVAPDGDTIMATESRTSEKPIMIFPVFIILDPSYGSFMGR